MEETQFDSFVGRIPWRRDRLPTPVFLGFPWLSAGKESAYNAGDLGLIPGLGRSPGEGKGYPLQYSGLENYSPWGCKELDTTERLSLHFTSSDRDPKMTTLQHLVFKGLIYVFNKGRQAPGEGFLLFSFYNYRVHGVLHARILEWVVSPFSRVSSQPRDQTQVSRIAGRFFTS